MVCMNHSSIWKKIFTTRAGTVYILTTAEYNSLWSLWRSSQTAFKIVLSPLSSRVWIKVLTVLFISLLSFTTTLGFWIKVLTASIPADIHLYVGFLDQSSAGINSCWHTPPHWVFGSVLTTLIPADIHHHAGSLDQSFDTVNSCWHTPPRWVFPSHACCEQSCRTCHHCQFVTIPNYCTTHCHWKHTVV